MSELVPVGKITNAIIDALGDVRNGDDLRRAVAIAAVRITLFYQQALAERGVKLPETPEIDADDSHSVAPAKHSGTSQNPLNLDPPQ